MKARGGRQEEGLGEVVERKGRGIRLEAFVGLVEVGSRASWAGYR